MIGDEVQKLKAELLERHQMPSRSDDVREFDRFRRCNLSRMPNWARKNPALGRVIEAFEDELRQRRQIDFDEMIRLGVTLVKRHAWVRRAIKAKFPVLVIDEYQDLGFGLDLLVRTLLDSGVRVIAVGDPDQSIYGFTGADPCLLKNLFARADVDGVELQTNYRCAQNIIDTAVDALGEARSFQAFNTGDGFIFEHSIEVGLRGQIEFAVDSILPQLEQHSIPSGEIAFLYLDRNDGAVVSEVLEDRQIHYKGGTEEARYKASPLTHWIEVYPMGWTKTGRS